MACLTAWSRTHLFFIVLFFSILTLPLSSLSRAQFALQHLARGRHGQLHTELDETWILVVSHVLLRPGYQLDFCDGRTVLDNNEGFHLFPVTVVWHADDGCQAHGRVGHQHLFDFTWVDVEAAANNHILHPVDDVEIALFCAPPDVPGVDPAMAHRFGGGFWAFVIALHHVVPPDSDLPYFAGLHVLVVRIDQAYLDAPYGKTDRSGPGFAIQAIENGNGAGFREAIPLQDFDVELLVKGPHHLHRHSRSARDSNAQVAGDFLQVVLVGLGVVEHRPVHDLHACDNGAVLFLHLQQSSIRTKARQQHQGGPVVEAGVHLHGLPKGVEQRQGDQMHIMLPSGEHHIRQAGVEGHFQWGAFCPLWVSPPPPTITHKRTATLHPPAIPL